MNENTLKQVFDALEIDREESRAKAYGITYVDNQLVAKHVSDHPDIYSLIDNINDDKIVENTNFDYFTFITYGWAAPLNEHGETDCPPSQHEARRRVRLIVAVDVKNHADMASIVQFGDDPDNLIYDHGNASGALADAISTLFN